MRVENMKRVALLWLTTSLFVTLLAGFASAQSQSLGDYARQVRKQKGQKSAVSKGFDDDSMPKSESISVVGQPRPQQPAEDASNTKSKDAGQDAQSNTDNKDDTRPEAQAKADVAQNPAPPLRKKDGGSERDKLNQDWQKKLDEQKKQIDLLSRELDVLQREYRLRAAAMYADAGNRMRNAGQWDKEDADYKEKIAAKQQSVDDAKQKLEDMKEEARKAGVPTVYRE